MGRSRSSIPTYVFLIERQARVRTPLALEEAGIRHDEAQHSIALLGQANVDLVLAKIQRLRLTRLHRDDGGPLAKLKLRRDNCYDVHLY